jgi:hypothetical protein
MPGDPDGDTSIVRIVGVGRLLRDESERPQPSQITLASERFLDLDRRGSLVGRT